MLKVSTSQTDESVSLQTTPDIKEYRRNRIDNGDESTKSFRSVSLVPPDDSSDDMSRIKDLDKSGIFRRRSTFRGIAKSVQKVLAFEKEVKMNNGSLMKTTSTLENTFRLAPKERCYFNAKYVERIIASLMHSQLNDVQYDSKKCTFLTRKITEMVKTKVKQMGFVRYKLVSNVMLGQCNDQSLEAVSRCVWDSKTDGCASVLYKNDSLFVVVTVYGVYFE